MMDVDDFVVLGVFCIYVFVFGLVFVTIGVVAGYISTQLHLHGVLWWCMTFLCYLFIAGLLAMINRIGVRR